MVGLEEVAVVGEEDGRGGDAGRRDVGVSHVAALVRMEVWVGTGVSLITYTSGNECRRVEKSSLAELEERAWGTAPMAPCGAPPRGAEARTAVPRASRCIRRVSRMERVVKDRGAGGRHEILRSPPVPSRVAAARDGVELSSSKKVGENFRGRVRRGPARAYRVAGSGDAGGGRAGAL